MEYIIIALLGLIAGSFFNVVIRRLPLILQNQWQASSEHYFGIHGADKQQITLIKPRSYCPQCGHHIPWYDNIPLLSFIWLKGKCAHCGNFIGWRYPIVELVTAVIGLLAILWFGLNPRGIWSVVFLWGAIPLFVIDIDYYLLPDQWVLGLLWLGLVANTHYLFTTPEMAIYGAAGGYLALWLIGHIFYKLRKTQGLGYGDFKLTAMLGAWIGPIMLPFAVFFGAVLGVLTGILMIALNKKSWSEAIPFGPFLLVGATIMLMAGPNILTFYTRLLAGT